MALQQNVTKPATFNTEIFTYIKCTHYSLF